MPEAFAVIIVFFAVVVVYVAAWLQARDPARQDPREELARLQQQEAWLTQRLAVARRENWDHNMVATLSAELGATTLQLARVSESRPRA